MSLKRSWYVFGRELKLSPRSPLVFFAIAMPLIMTFLISSVFGSLFEASPRLGIVDEGSSGVTAAALQLEGVDTVVVSDVEALRERVESYDLDAGLVLPASFDTDLEAGAQPDLEFYVSGSSLASNRVILLLSCCTRHDSMWARARLDRCHEPNQGT
jgi:ABC-2 type transport system permease protein